MYQRLVIICQHLLQSCRNLTTPRFERQFDSVVTLGRWATTSFGGTISSSARAYRSAGSIPFLSRSACTGWYIRYTVYGVRCTVYVIRFIQIVGGVVQRKPRQGSSADRSARSRLGFCTLALHGKWYTRPVCSCHREACAVFYFAALAPTAAHSAAYSAF